MHITHLAKQLKYLSVLNFTPEGSLFIDHLQAHICYPGGVVVKNISEGLKTLYNEVSVVLEIP